MDCNTLRMFHSRFQCLLATFEQIDPVHSSLAACEPLLRVINFCTLVGLYDNGFMTIIEPPFISRQNPSSLISSQCTLKMICCDASIGMKPLFSLFKHVIFTSGTLSPLDLYPKLLGFQPMVARSICVDANPRLLPVVVTRGNDQVGENECTQE